MEEPSKIESKESAIDKLIEDLAEREGMNPEDILSDIITFIELSKEDDDAKVYFEEVAEKIGISFDEMLEYSLKKAEEM
jgi:hypothetical protein